MRLTYATANGTSITGPPFPLSRGIFPLSEWLKHLIKLFWQEGSSISQIIILLEK